MFRHLERRNWQQQGPWQDACPPVTQAHAALRWCEGHACMHRLTSRYTGRPSQPTASTRSPVRRSGMATVRPSAVVTVAEAGKQTHCPA